MKRSGDALQPQGSDIPVRVTAGPLHQIQLLACAADKATAQFRKQRTIPISS